MCVCVSLSLCVFVFIIVFSLIHSIERPAELIAYTNRMYTFMYSVFICARSFAYTKLPQYVVYMRCIVTTMLLCIRSVDYSVACFCSFIFCFCWNFDIFTIKFSVCTCVLKAMHIEYTTYSYHADIVMRIIAGSFNWIKN